MSTLDDRVQQAQEHLSSIAEDGSYIHDIIELLDELYALQHEAKQHPETPCLSASREEQRKAQIAYGKRPVVDWGNHCS
jgi:hypothetical protein